MFSFDVYFSESEDDLQKENSISQLVMEASFKENYFHLVLAF